MRLALITIASPDLRVLLPTWDRSPSQKAAKKKRFSPNWSQELVVLNKMVQEAFPNIQYLGWETRVLHEFMIHQPGQNLFIIETEKDMCESVFNHLSQRYPGQTFLDSDRLTMERYVLHQPDIVRLYGEGVVQEPAPSG